ncbi:cysteine proteinase [Obba rivulosa]|uniref:ubiquitinyl hydrolase 1 n=1 Tax=Obba rivulosa TaxID=1052685 RepID=A0A8E2B3F7_9APHY|nr:cysteine proteinase [Obba rivulosa]
MSEEIAHNLVGGPFAVVESDPGVFTTLIQKLGVHGLEVTEIYDIEPWAVDHLRPLGLIFCYISSETEESSNDEAYELDDPDARSVWFANQLSNDACASLALLNVLLNCPGVDLGPRLDEFRADTEHMSSVMKGLAVTNAHFLREAHNSLARPADIRGATHAAAKSTLESSKRQLSKPPPTKKRKLTIPRKPKPASALAEDAPDSYHFIGYVPAHGHVWELDGLRARVPLDVGALEPTPGPSGSAQPSTDDWMAVVRPALRMKMARVLGAGERADIRYNLLALVRAPYGPASDALEMRKRERAAIERRLGEAFPDGWADKVDPTLLSAADSAFSTTLRPASYGRVFASDFAARKMDRELEILDMPARRLPSAWEESVRAALSDKVTVEEEIAKSMNVHTEHVKRTWDYEPFIRKFVTCLHQEGLLDRAMSGKSGREDARERDA